MNYRLSLLVETALVLVEIALALAALCGSPILERSQPNPEAVIGYDHCDAPRVS